MREPNGVAADFTRPVLPQKPIPAGSVHRRGAGRERGGAPAATLRCVRDRVEARRAGYVAQRWSGVLAGSALAALTRLGSTCEVLLLLTADGLMLAVGLTACAVALRRALTIDPTEALRAEG